ncbi:MAG: hypothetical protein HRF52_13365 [Ignavibacterium sp.]
MTSFTQAIILPFINSNIHLYSPKVGIHQFGFMLIVKKDFSSDKSESK